MKKAPSSKSKIENKNTRVQKSSDDFAEKATRFIGSKTSLKFHSVFFILCFLPILFGAKIDTVLLFLTTVVSLEAIYLAIFIQLTVNKHSEELVEVAKDVDEIQEDIDEIQEDVDEIQEDIDEIQTDVDEIEKDIDEIEEDTSEETQREKKTEEKLKDITSKMEELIIEINKLNKK
jgi:SMC interacting uncharacterized protein involved in chromosome segregation